MDILKLINEYKKIEIKENDDPYLFYVILTTILLTSVIMLLSLFSLSFLPITYIGNIMFPILTIFVIFFDIPKLTYQVLTYKTCRKLYIESKLKKSIYIGPLANVLEVSVITSPKGTMIKYLREQIIANKGLPCCIILNHIKKHKIFEAKRIKDLKKKHQEEEKIEINSMLIKENTITGKNLQFLNEI